MGEEEIIQSVNRQARELGELSDTVEQQLLHTKRHFQTFSRWLARFQVWVEDASAPDTAPSPTPTAPLPLGTSHWLAHPDSLRWPEINERQSDKAVSS